MLKAIHAQESKTAARETAKSVVGDLKAMKLKEAAKKLEDGIVNIRQIAGVNVYHIS